MTKLATAPAAPKTLDLDNLLDDFQPRSSIKPAALSSPSAAAKPRAVQKTTVFPSREGPKHVQVNCYLKAPVAERFKLFLQRDEYTTWNYGQAIEFLLDYHERAEKKSRKS